MKPLLLVKHSVPEIVEGMPAREWVLSEEGRERARKLVALLLPYQTEMILSLWASTAVSTVSRNRASDCLAVSFPNTSRSGFSKYS